MEKNKGGQRRPAFLIRLPIGANHDYIFPIPFSCPEWNSCQAVFLSFPVFSYPKCTASAVRPRFRIST